MLGRMIQTVGWLYSSMDNPTRRHWRNDTSEADGCASGQPGSVYNLQRGYELIAAMQPDVGNDLRHELDHFISPSLNRHEGLQVLCCDRLFVPTATCCQGCKSWQVETAYKRQSVFQTVCA